ncbi:YopX family protein [Bacillus toyonensis]|uniref:YopX family protein n=1 Tax=Bacillus toyonensis TaxID=155322 RepID=UPI0021D143E0|nr:YopX family protein [Bacillus toyonensis]MCU5181557.1 YopX family protein [Bacillus toyonensis]
MREIKFRAWSKAANMFLDITGFETEKGRVYGLFHDGDYIGYDKEDIHLMQYTGLKDKNGKEIYEGDIVSRHDGGIHFQEEALAEHVVKWGNFGWIPFEIGEGYQKCVYGEIYEFIVIGNIYENSELLKTK